ncbi:CDP-glycerol glycerophosphotransferase family protein [Streptomyces sp. NPDC050418]|uniref:bifunctional glycosyltransferase/CDP-glycerol:glycerophosphate glycerophosphotransferase n=1 Tax=Streptomyces sp. NPDC050418 TaxID=3365612 RepID=UPI0037B1C2A7
MNQPGQDRPRISVIVPVFKVQGYLRECLDSVLGQDFTDFELIAVDDCSPDGCGAILDEYAARDPRVRPVHLTENGGIGNARNVGVEHARGTYLFFLDSDDTITDGALRAMAERLDVCEDPEILLFDHVRTYWWNKEQPSASGELLEAAGATCFRPVDRPETLHMFAVVWNRLYRRDFFTRNGFAFTSGLYEDALMVYTTMLTAERVACLDRVCVEYRQRRSGNSMRTPGRKHFTIFPQYRRLFDFLDARDGLDALRPFLFERMVSHFLFTLARTDRVMPRDRREFFRRAAAMYRAYEPAGFEPPEGLMGAKFRALRLGSYAAFQVSKQAHFGLQTAGRRARRTKRALGRRAYAAHYRMQLRRPLDENLAVYGAYWNRRPACNPLAIHERAKELAPQIHGVWVVSQEVADEMPAGMDYVVVNTPRYWEVMARAKYLVNNVNFSNDVVKREGQVYLQTHHGTPLKRMGIDQQRFPAAAKGMSFRKLLERADRWDLSLSSNQHSTEHWERVYPCDFTSLDLGYPRNDVYFRARAEDVIGIRERLGIAPGTKALLYAPTVRDYQAGFVPRLDFARLARELGPDFVLLVRTHYFYKEDPELRELERRGLVKDVSAHPSVEELCLASDALIGDYSSLMFDYACLDRPIVTFADDWDVYVKARGVTFDLLSGEPGETPGEVATTEDELIALFRDGSWNGERSARRRAAFRERFCPYDDGHAAERVVRRVFLGEQGPGILPLAERRTAPSPTAAEEALRAETAEGLALLDGSSLDGSSLASG